MKTNKGIKLHKTPSITHNLSNVYECYIYENILL